MAGLDRSSGPQLTLIQLLPSSTVADGVRLKSGFGAVASTIPGGTPNPLGPPQPSATLHSGGTREPLQYELIKRGLEPPVSSVRCGESVYPELWLFGPVSPRTPISQ